jgi:hypothetical protein
MDHIIDGKQLTKSIWELSTLLALFRLFPMTQGR